MLNMILSHGDQFSVVNFKGQSLYDFSDQKQNVLNQSGILVYDQLGNENHYSHY